jgi:hypothetical protein
LSAVTALKVAITQGALIHTPQDARLYGVGYFFWCRGSGQALLGAIVSGMAVYLPLHTGLGW